MSGLGMTVVALTGRTGPNMVDVSPAGSSATSAQNALVTDSRPRGSALWFYVPPTTGLGNTTTPVQIAAAGGAGTKLYLTGFEIACSGITLSQNIIIRESGGGATLWQTQVLTTGIALTPVYLGANGIPTTASNIGLELVWSGLITVGTLFLNARGYIL